MATNVTQSNSQKNKLINKLIKSLLLDSHEALEKGLVSTGLLCV